MKFGAIYLTTSEDIIEETELDPEPENTETKPTTSGWKKSKHKHSLRNRSE